MIAYVCGKFRLRNYKPVMRLLELAKGSGARSTKVDTVFFAKRSRSNKMLESVSYYFVIEFRNKHLGAMV